MCQTFLIGRFEESRAEHLMNLNCGPDNLFRESVHNYTLCVLSASAVSYHYPLSSIFDLSPRRTAISWMNIFLSMGLVT
jgi:hypothetical protein